MSTALVEVRRALKMGSTIADQALTFIGNNEGDAAVAVVVQEMTPAEVTSVVADFDMTKSTVVSHHMTCDQFIELVERIGLFIHEVKSLDPGGLRMIQDRLESILMPILVMGNDCFYSERIEALLNLDYAYELLALLAIDQKDYEDFIRDPNKSMACRGTWQELFAEIYMSYPKTDYLNILSVIENINDGVLEVSSDKEGYYNARDEKIVHIINSMVYRAREKIASEKPEETEEEQVFVDL